MTNENQQLIKLDQDLSDEALKTLQEQANTFPAVVTTEKEYKEIYEHHQKIKKIRIAVEKKAKELIKDSKVKFELHKGEILAEETKIFLILSPIEVKLMETRTAWEDEKERVKREKAEIEAEKQRIEFERQEAIREEIRLKAELEELRIEAYAENERFDQRKREDEARKVEDKRLKAEREAFEKEKAEFEAKKETEFLPIKTAPKAVRDPNFQIDPDPNCGACGGSGRFSDGIPREGGMMTVVCECTKKQPLKSFDEQEKEKIEVIKMQNIVENTIPVDLGLPPSDVDPDKPKFDEIFMVFKELQICVDHHIEKGFTEPDATKAAYYMQKRLNEFYKDVTTEFNF